MADQQLTCRDCGQTFAFTEGEQQFFASKNLSAPQRCKDCRTARKSQRMQDRQMHDAVCAQCGAACQVPFKPRPVEEGGRPVLCKACFDAQRGGGMGGGGRSRPSSRDTSSDDAEAPSMDMAA